jgi:hypothetical protein
LARKENKLIVGQRYLILVKRIGNFYLKGVEQHEDFDANECVFSKGSCIALYLGETRSKRGTVLYKFKCEFLLKGNRDIFNFFGNGEGIISFSLRSNILQMIKSTHTIKCPKCSYCKECMSKSVKFFGGCNNFKPSRKNLSGKYGHPTLDI